MKSDSASQRELLLRTFSEAAPIYDRSRFFELFGRRLVERAEIQRGARVLDIGTGSGAVLIPAAEATGPEGNAIGIDFADAMVAAAAKEIKRRKLLNAEVRLMDAEQLRFPSDSFDCVLIGFTIFLIPQLDVALREIQRVLVPGGMLVMSTWGKREEWVGQYESLQRKYGATGPSLSSHILDTPELLEAALLQAGFEDVRITSEEAAVHFSNEEDWWEGRTFSQVLNASRLEPDKLQQFKEETFALLQVLRVPEGLREARKAIIATSRLPARP